MGIQNRYAVYMQISIKAKIMLVSLINLGRYEMKKFLGQNTRYKMRITNVILRIFINCLLIYFLIFHEILLCCAFSSRDRNEYI